MIASPFEPWRRHFLENRDAPPAIPWEDPYRLTAGERRLVARSIQQFQLGEWARGRGLKRRAESHPVLGADPGFVPALELFIAEEQGHSQMLGRFLDREHLPRLAHNWLDGVFRRLRKLAGLDVCVSVLVTAEVLAVPFYQALRDATRSPLLRAICARILRDEAAHLRYQALTISLLRGRLSHAGHTARAFIHKVLFRGTALLVWQQHRRVFRVAGWNFGRFWHAAHRCFAPIGGLPEPAPGCSARLHSRA